MTIKAVLFDIDGTLVDSNDQHVAAWQDVFCRIGARFDEATIHEQIGKGTDMLVPALLPEAGAAEQERLGHDHGALFRTRFLDHIRPFPRARDLLARVVASGRQVVLASSASAQELDHYVGLLDAEDLVSVSTTADDVERTKPAPDIFSTALAKLAPLTPSEVIVVGDTPYDIEAAGRCGISAVGVRSGKFGDDALFGAGAVAVYDDVGALLDAFDGSALDR